MYWLSTGLLVGLPYPHFTKADREKNFRPFNVLLSVLLSPALFSGPSQQHRRGTRLHHFRPFHSRHSHKRCCERLCDWDVHGASQQWPQLCFNYTQHRRHSSGRWRHSQWHCDLNRANQCCIRNRRDPYHWGGKHSCHWCQLCCPQVFCGSKGKRGL